MRVYGITDIGKARSINQDSYAVEMLEDAETGVLLVCDGMGGVKGGEIASSVAVKAIMDSLRIKLKPKMNKQNIKSALEEAIKQANKDIISRALSEENLMGMGTTCVCAVVCENNITIANIGDSRAYVVENEKGRKQELDCDCVVLSLGVKSDKTLYEELKDEAGNIYLIGDGEKAGRIADATRSAFECVKGIN